MSSAKRSAIWSSKSQVIHWSQILFQLNDISQEGFVNEHPFSVCDKRRKMFPILIGSFSCTFEFFCAWCSTHCQSKWIILWWESSRHQRKIGNKHISHNAEKIEKSNWIMNVTFVQKSDYVLSSFKANTYDDSRQPLDVGETAQRNPFKRWFVWTSTDTICELSSASCSNELHRHYCIRCTTATIQYSFIEIIAKAHAHELVVIAIFLESVDCTWADSMVVEPTIGGPPTTNSISVIIDCVTIYAHWRHKLLLYRNSLFMKYCVTIR